MRFSLIAACDKERGIGKAGVLPWRLPKELEHFHHVTAETRDAAKRNAVIMGRKTWESIPEGRRPLPGRLNCVITRDAAYPFPEGVLKFGSLEECLEYLNRHPVLDTGSRNKIEKVFIIGGGELFRQAISMPMCDTIYLTEVDGIYQCDTFFPEIPDTYKKVQESEPLAENGTIYRFVVYQKE